MVFAEIQFEIAIKIWRWLPIFSYKLRWWILKFVNYFFDAGKLIIIFWLWINKRTRFWRYNFFNITRRVFRGNLRNIFNVLLVLLEEEFRHFAGAIFIFAGFCLLRFITLILILTHLHHTPPLPQRNILRRRRTRFGVCNNILFVKLIHFFEHFIKSIIHHQLRLFQPILYRLARPPHIMNNHRQKPLLLFQLVFNHF